MITMRLPHSSQTSSDSSSEIVTSARSFSAFFTAASRSGFPECRNTKPYFEKIGVACPKCGKDIVMKKTKKGRRYYGCIDNPECDFMVWQKPSGEKCPRCGKLLLEKGNKLVCMDEQCGYVKNKPTEEK